MYGFIRQAQHLLTTLGGIGPGPVPAFSRKRRSRPDARMTCPDPATSSGQRTAGGFAEAVCQAGRFHTRRIFLSQHGQEVGSVWTLRHQRDGTPPSDGWGASRVCPVLASSNGPKVKPYGKRWATRHGAQKRVNSDSAHSGTTAGRALRTGIGTSTQPPAGMPSGAWRHRTSNH